MGRVSEIPEADHFESFVARETARFLKTHGKRQPFFPICSVLKPHDPFMPAPRFAAMFREEDMKLPRTWGKVDLSRTPQEVRNAIENSGATPEREVVIVRGAVSPDHIHRLLSAPPHLAPMKLVPYVKGRSSRRLQEEFPELRKRYWGQHLWARGYFCATVGAVDEATICLH